MDTKTQLEPINKVLTTMALTLIVILGTRQIAQDLIVPALLTIFLTVLIYPLYKWFRSKGFSSTFSVLFMILTIVIGLGAFSSFVVWSFSLIIDSVGTYVSAFKLEVFKNIQNWPVDKTVVEQLTKSIDPNSVVNIVKQLSGGILSNVGSFVLYFGIIPMLAILMVVQIDTLPKSTADLISKDSKALDRAKNFAESITIYLSGRLKVNIITGVLLTISLLVLGVDFALIWGVLVVLLSFIPYIGLVIAGVPPVILAFIESGPWGALFVVISILLINLVTENIVEPYIQGKESKISTAAVITALIFWSWLLGPVGAILSVPLTISIKFILSEYKETHWIALLMEGNYQQAAQAKNSKKTLLEKVKGVAGKSN
jgi:predicted PurR-regulated permease PerM